MNKDQVITYLSSQLEKIEQPYFDLNIWKESLAGFVDGIFGKGNVYAKQFRGLDYEEKISYEELYPKKVIDKEKSESKFRLVVHEMIEQLQMLPGDAFGNTENGSDKGAQTLESVITALKNNLTGKQILQLKQIVLKNKEDGQWQYLLAEVKKMEMEVTQNILAEILSSKEVWDRV